MQNGRKIDLRTDVTMEDFILRGIKYCRQLISRNDTGIQSS